MKDFRKVDNIHSVQEMKKSASAILYKKELKRKKSEDLKIYKNNKNSRKYNYNNDYKKCSNLFEKIKGSPKKVDINIIKDKNKKSKTTEGKINYFKSFLGKNKLLSQSEIYNKKNNCNGKRDKEINLDKKERQNISVNNNILILLTKLNEYQKKEIMNNYNRKSKKKNNDKLKKKI